MVTIDTPCQTFPLSLAFQRCSIHSKFYRNQRPTLVRFIETVIHPTVQGCPQLTFSGSLFSRQQHTLSFCISAFLSSVCPSAITQYLFFIFFVETHIIFAYQIRFSRIRESHCQTVATPTLICRCEYRGRSMFVLTTRLPFAFCISLILNPKRLLRICPKWRGYWYLAMNILSCTTASFRKSV